MRVAVSSILLFSLTASAWAQNARVYYTKTNRRTIEVDSAAFYVDFAPKVDSLIPYTRFSKDNRLLETGYTSSAQNLKRYGWAAYFYPDGKIKDSIEFKNGMPTGNRVHFFSDGKTNFRISGKPASYVNGKPMSPELNYLYTQNPVGKVLLENGNGLFQAYDDSLQLREEGNVLNGLQNGEWKGFSNKGDVLYKEVYENGKLLSGESFDKARTKYRYTVKEVLPEPQGGLEKLYNYIQNKFIYPPELVHMNKKGRVLLNFVVQPDGTLTDIRVVQSFHPLADKEAVRVLLKSPPWNPGRQRGQPVRVAFTLPVNLAIQ